MQESTSIIKKNNSESTAPQSTAPQDIKYMYGNIHANISKVGFLAKKSENSRMPRKHLLRSY